MSDFLTELRGDLVGAHARYGQHGRAGRLARPVHPRTWRPAPILAAAAAAACLVAAVIGIRSLRTPTPAKVRVVEEIHVGGQPNGAAAGFGYLWVTDFGGNVIQVDTVHHRVVRRIPVGGSADSITAGVGAVWATTVGGPNQSGRLVRIDPRTGRVTASVPLRTASAVVRAGGGVVWLDSTHDLGVTLKRADPVTGRIVATVSSGEVNLAIAIGGDSLWTLAPTGVLEQRDLESGHVLRTLPGLGAALNYNSDTPVAAGENVVWVLRPGAIVRIVGGRVVRRIPLRFPTLPTLADDGSALWVATGRQYPTSYGIVRLDRGTGKPTGTLDLGSHQPKALVPSPRGLWVIGGDGTALLVR